MKTVKILVSLLASVILFHGACLGRCMGERSRVDPQTTVPPCHHQNESPGEKHSSAPSNICTEGLLLEAKISQVLKCLVFTESPVFSPSLSFIKDETWMEFGRFDGFSLSPSPVRQDVLRI